MSSRRMQLVELYAHLREMITEELYQIERGIAGRLASQENRMIRYFNDRERAMEKRLKDHESMIMYETTRLAGETTLAVDDVIYQLSVFIKACKDDREKTEKKLREAEEKLARLKPDDPPPPPPLDEGWIDHPFRGGD